MAKPMVLTKENVLATMRGDKTMTRRIINPQPKICPYENRPTNHPKSFLSHTNKQGGIITGVMTTQEYAKEYARYQVGDTVYVAEGCKIAGPTCFPRRMIVTYLADGQERFVGISKREWKLWSKRKFPYRVMSGRFMYKSLARTFMTITGVGVERVQDISFEDCRAEGCRAEYSEIVKDCGHPDCKGKHYGEKWAFANFWNSIHGAGAWDLNPYVWVYKWELIYD